MREVLNALVILVIVAMYAGVAIIYAGESWRRASRPAPPVDLQLGGDPRLPGGGYPDSWTPATTGYADLAAQIWPSQEWRRMLVCPRPTLDGHPTRVAAELATDRSRQSRASHCACGAWHIRYRRTGRTKASGNPT